MLPCPNFIPFSLFWVVSGVFQERWWWIPTCLSPTISLVCPLGIVVNFYNYLGGLSGATSVGHWKGWGVYEKDKYQLLWKSVDGVLVDLAKFDGA